MFNILQYVNKRCKLFVENYALKYYKYDGAESKPNHIANSRKPLTQYSIHRAKVPTALIPIHRMHRVDLIGTAHKRPRSPFRGVALPRATR